MVRRILLIAMVLWSGACAYEVSAHRALEQELRRGMLDSATALRLEELLDHPVADPSEIPPDLLDRIPGVDPDCLGRVHALSSSPRSDAELADALGDVCAQALGEYLGRSGPATGELRIRSSALVDDAPGWRREALGRLEEGPARLLAGWSPDRSSPWLRRRAEIGVGSGVLGMGDLQGWQEVPDLWSRPIVALPSREFLDGSGASMNGTDLSVRDAAVELRAAVHSRMGHRALATGIGKDGHFLALAGGRMPRGSWTGAGARIVPNAASGLSLCPSASVSQERWNRALRIDAHGMSGAILWSAWGAAREERFRSPFSPLPGWIRLLGKDSLGCWAGGGFAIEGSGDPKLHGSLAAGTDSRGSSSLLPTFGVVHRGEGMRTEGSLRGVRIARADAEAVTGWSARQTCAWGLGKLRPSLGWEGGDDTLGWRLALEAGAHWSPLAQWEASALYRQDLSDQDLREASVSTLLRPAPGSDFLCEASFRSQARDSDDGRWYFRLEAVSRW